MKRTVIWALGSMLVLLGGCATTPSGDAEGDTLAGGEGYLGEGPTVHLEDARNDKFASPLEKLVDTTRRLEDAQESIAAMQARIDKLEDEGRYLQKTRVDLESSLMSAEEELARERTVQSQMAKTLARLRIRTVELEEELFHLKVEILERVPPADSTEATGGQDEPQRGGPR